ncbi:hypothetical protein Tco_0693582 [Tanacetum coccineum]
MNDKSKDTAKARQDLKSLGIRSGLWLGQNKNGKCSKPQAAYSFKPEDRKKFCQFIKGVKLPDGFRSNFKHKVTDNDSNITGLKSHDCHIMMQRLLLYGLQQYLLPDMVSGVDTGVMAVDGGVMIVPFHTTSANGKGTRKPNLGAESGQAAYPPGDPNLGVKGCHRLKSSPVSLRFEFGTGRYPDAFGRHAAIGPNYLGELVGSVVAPTLSMHQTQFDMRPHMESDRWPLIYAAIQQHLQKIYNGKKAALKERHWIPDSDGTYDLERIRLSRPSHISEVNWDAQIAFWNDPKNRARATQNKQNRAKSKVGLGSNTETGVPYTEDEIMAIVHGASSGGTFPVLVRFCLAQTRSFHLCLHARTPLMSLSSKRERRLGGGKRERRSGMMRQGDDGTTARDGRIEDDS